MMRTAHRRTLTLSALALVVAGAGALALSRGGRPEPAEGPSSDRRPSAGGVPLPTEGPTSIAGGGAPAPRVPPAAANGGATDVVPGELVVTVKSWDAPEPPIPGASVSVLVDGTRMRGQTDAEGIARFRLATPGRYEVHAIAEGRVPRDDVVIVEAGQATSVAFGLRTGSGFDGIVVAADDGRPVVGATVRYRTMDRGLIGTGSSATFYPDDIVVAGEDGRFRVPGMPDDGRTALRADAPGFHHAVTIVEAWDMPPAGVRLRLFAGGRVRGIVRDRDGKAVAGAKVFVFPPRDPPRKGTVPSDDILVAETAVDGAYLVDGTALEAPYSVRAQAPGYAPSVDVEHVVTTAVDREARADPVLRRPATVIVHAIDLEGLPVPDATIHVDDSRASTDGQGTCRFEGLPPDGYRVWTESLLFRPAGTQTDLKEGQTVDLRLALDPGARIEGLVLGAGDQPLAGASLELEVTEGGPKLDLPPFALRSDDGGRFRIGGLLPGDYLVSAQKEGFRALPMRIRAPSVDVRLRCSPLGGVRLRILTPDGAPYVQGVNIGVTSALGGRNHYVRRFDAEGRLTLGGLDAGPITLDVRPFDWPPLRIPCVLGPGETLDLGDHRLAEGVPFSGVVRDAAGNPVVGASVSVSGVPPVETDPDGRFTVLHLTPGEWEVLVGSPEFLGARRRVEIAAGAPPASFVLARGGLLRGVLKDAKGEPLERGTLHVQWAGSEPAPEEADDWTRSRSEGRVEWRLAPGRWRVTYRSEDFENVPLGEWTVVEGHTSEADFTLPAK